MGHSASPNGLSNVGTPISIHLGVDMVQSGVAAEVGRKAPETLIARSKAQLCEVIVIEAAS